MLSTSARTFSSGLFSCGVGNNITQSTPPHTLLGFGIIGGMKREELTRLLPAIRELCAQYGVTELAVFGSVARGEATDSSDVDLLYVRGPHAVRGLAFFEFADQLSELLGTPVDLVPKAGLNQVIRDRVLAEAKVLYAAA